MITRRISRMLLLALLTAALAVLVGVGGASAASNKLELTARFGWEVNATTHGDLCTAQFGNTCQGGVVSEAAGGSPSPTASRPVR